MLWKIQSCYPLLSSHIKHFFDSFKTWSTSFLVFDRSLSVAFLHKGSVYWGWGWGGIWSQRKRKTPTGLPLVVCFSAFPLNLWNFSLKFEGLKNLITSPYPIPLFNMCSMLSEDEGLSSNHLCRKKSFCIFKWPLAILPLKEIALPTTIQNKNSQ